MIRVAAALALAALVLLGSGCALLPAGRTAPTGASPAAPAGPPAVVVEIDAPTALKALLERHLDLVRLETVARGETVTDQELTRLIDATPRQVRDLLETEGHFSPEVRIERPPGRDATGAERLRLTLRPGPQALISRADIEAEGDLATEAEGGDARAAKVLADLRAAWPMKKGTPFRNTQWSDAKNAALSRLRAAGYAAARWSGTAAQIDAATASARVFLVADSGPLFRSGEVTVEGLKLHDRQTVLNLADLVPGTPVTETLLLDFQDRLQKAGLFERVSVTLDPDPEQAAQARIAVQVTELARHQLIVGLGVTANLGQRVTLEHVDRRLFGAAATARNKFEWGRSRQAWDGEVSTHPRAGLHRWLAGGSIERLESSSDVVLTQRVRLGRSQDLARFERFGFAEVNRSSRRAVGARSDATAYALNYHWTVREVDNPILPIDGYTLTLQGAAGQARDSDDRRGSFGRAYGRFTFYRPLGRAWYAQARFEAGQVVAPGGLDVPDALRFRAGGDDSVRGYGYRSLGPLIDGSVGSGKVLMAGSLELARPLAESMPQLWGAVFVDAGNAADSFQGFRAALGTGVGVRWRSPVGPLRLDLAYGQEVRRLRLHFSVGIVL